MAQKSIIFLTVKKSVNKFSMVMDLLNLDTDFAGI